MRGVSGKAKMDESDEKTDKVQASLLFSSLFVPLSLVLVGSRNLSRLHVGPIYFYDFVMVLAFLAAGAFFIRQGSISFRRGDIALFSATLLLPLAATIWFLFSDFSRDSLRELHPYLYVTYAPVVALALRHATPSLLHIGMKMISLALGIFWGLVSIRQLNEQLEWGLGLGFWEDFFSIREDVDGFILGVFAALVFFTAVRKPMSTRLPLFGLVIMLHIQIGWMENRAAQLAAFLMLLLAITIATRKEQEGRSRSLVTKRVVQGSAVFIIVVALSLSITAIGARYVGAVMHFVDVPVAGQTGSQEMESELEAEESMSSFFDSDRLRSGEGTVRARLDAWTTLSLWMWEDPQRFFLGVGVGTEYFWESGTREALAGTGPREEGENRWPHNYLLTTFALLGFPMALLLGALTAVGLFRLWRRVDPPLGDVREVALVVLSGVTVVSFFGVVFENPFGSLPFAWALGVAFAGHGERSNEASMWITRGR